MDNRDKAEQYFIELGLMPKREDRTEQWCLHHVDESLRHNDPERYNLWLPEDLIPLTSVEHKKLHAKGEKNSMYGKNYQWYNNGNENIKVFEGQCVPDGFSVGMSVSWDSPTKGKICYTNGYTNIYLKVGQDIPNGFYKGRKEGNNKSKIYYTNGVENKMIKEGDSIPEGFYKGRTTDFSGKNNPMYGKKYFWINNGQIRKKVFEGQEIPEGFVKGYQIKENSIWE